LKTSWFKQNFKYERLGTLLVGGGHKHVTCCWVAKSPH